MSWILYINTSITVKLEQLRDICVKEELSRENCVFLSRFPNALFAWLPFKSHSDSFNYSVSNSQIASRKRITRCWCKQWHRQHVTALRTCWTTSRRQFGNSIINLPSKFWWESSPIRINTETVRDHMKFLFFPITTWGNYLLSYCSYLVGEDLNGNLISTVHSLPNTRKVKDRIIVEAIFGSEYSGLIHHHEKDQLKF